MPSVLVWATAFIGALGCVLVAYLESQELDREQRARLDSIAAAVSSGLMASIPAGAARFEPDVETVRGLAGAGSEAARVVVLTLVPSGFQVVADTSMGRAPSRPVWSVSEVQEVRARAGWAEARRADGRRLAVATFTAPGSLAVPRASVLVAATAVFIVVIGLLCASLVGRVSPRRSPFLAGRPGIRRGLLEGLLLVSVTLLAIQALQAGFRSDALRIVARAEHRAVRSLLHSAQLLGDLEDGGQEEIVARSLREAGHHDLAERVMALASVPAQERKAQSRAVATEIELRAGTALDRVDRLAGQRAEARSGSTESTLLAFVLVIVALAGIRVVSGHRERLVEVESERERLQSDYDRLLDSLPIPVIGFSEGRGLFANEAWEEIDCLGDRDPLAAFLGRVVDGDREAVRRTMARAEEERTSAVFQAQVRTFSKGTLQMEVRVAPVFTPEGELRHYLAFCLDTTAAYRAERMLLARNDEVRRVNRELTRMLDDLEDGLQSVVHTMVRAIEAKDGYTAGHSERVKTFSLWIGEELGLGPYEMRILELGTLIHDVGKIGIPDDVLRKPGKLTDEEYEMIKSHPTRGVEIVQGIAHFEACLPIVRWHHEKLDGSGYPDGISGDQIPLLVRIATVADIFDAMTSSRAYRGAICVREVLEVLSEEADAGKLDRSCVDALTTALTARSLLDSLESLSEDEPDRIAA